MTNLLLLSSLALFVAVCVAQSPAKPSLVPTFGATVSLAVDPLGNGVLIQMNGSIYYDETGKQVELDLYSSIFNQDLHYVTLDLATTSFEIANGVCRPHAGVFGSWFSWIASPATVFNGVSVTPSGVSCNNWLLRAGGSIVLEACADSQFVYAFVVQGTAKPINVTFDQLSALPSTPVLVPKSCSAPPPVCPAAPWSRLTIFRLHNVNDTELAQRNAASLIGDLYYVCSALLAGSAISGTGTVISMLEVDGNTTWGQYALCNRGVCVGGDNNTIGHEATSGFTLGGGQCMLHNNIGDWYSFTAASQCAANVTVPSTDCAWQFVKRVKSVSTQCLVAAGLKQACMADWASGGFPLKKSVALVTGALQSNKICPDIPPPPFKK